MRFRASTGRLLRPDKSGLATTEEATPGNDRLYSIVIGGFNNHFEELDSNLSITSLTLS